MNKKGIVVAAMGYVLAAVLGIHAATRTSLPMVNKTVKRASAPIRNQKTYAAGQSFDYSMTGFDPVSISAVPAGQELLAACEIHMYEK